VSFGQGRHGCQTRLIAVEAVFHVAKWGLANFIGIDASEIKISVSDLLFCHKEK